MNTQNWWKRLRNTELFWQTVNFFLALSKKRFLWFLKNMVMIEEHRLAMMNMISRWKIWFQDRMSLLQWQNWDTLNVWQSTHSRVRIVEEKESRVCRNWMMIISRNYSWPLHTIILCSSQIQDVYIVWKDMKSRKLPEHQEVQQSLICCSWCRKKRLQQWSQLRHMMIICAYLWQQSRGLLRRHHLENMSMCARKVLLQSRCVMTISWSK